MILINDDNLKIMDEMQEKSVDCVLTDPPYNISKETNFNVMASGNRQGMDFGEWDKNFDIKPFIQKLPRILKENANVVIFNSWSNLGEIERICEENNIYIKRCLVLSKRNPAPFNRDRLFVNDVEFALWGVYNSKGKPTGWTFNRENPLERCIIPAVVQSSKLHPTMKDLEVMKYLVRVLTKKGDVVFDPFMGSGTTGVACTEYERDFIGIELDEKYFNIAKERLKV
ncbi:MAG: site-specific DNA-methyltransferase [Desulfuromonadaceae bacterium]|nr:site-specific DNA-methyltransferase [Desulfuromonadaceae bacterium]